MPPRLAEAHEGGDARLPLYQAARWGGSAGYAGNEMTGNNTRLRAIYRHRRKRLVNIEAREGPKYFTISLPVE